MAKGKRQLDKTAALLFTFFLGGMGIHKFYFGQTTKGIFYLLFFWTTIPAVFAFVEFFVILFMDQATFKKRYC